MLSFSWLCISLSLSSYFLFRRDDFLKTSIFNTQTAFLSWWGAACDLHSFLAIAVRFWAASPANAQAVGSTGISHTPRQSLSRPKRLGRPPATPSGTSRVLYALSELRVTTLYSPIRQNAKSTSSGYPPTVRNFRIVGTWSKWTRHHKLAGA